MEKQASSIKIISKGKCECILEPCYKYGLEGFAKGDTLG